MDPLIGAALISTAGGGLLSGFGQKSANKQNLQIAREQMAFQERMANTAHQREVEDLRKAGLNPLLSAGAGAASPSGASATMGNVGAAAAKDISRAPEVVMALQQQRANIGQTLAQESYIKSQEDYVDAQKNNAELQNQLTQMTIDWYKDHPNFAPGVNPGFYTGTGASGIVDSLTSRAWNIGSKLGEFVGEKFYNLTHPNRPKYGHYDKKTHKMVYNND